MVNILTTDEPLLPEEQLAQTRKMLEKSQIRYVFALFLFVDGISYLVVCKFSVDLMITCLIAIGSFLYFLYRLDTKLQAISNDIKKLESILQNKHRKNISKNFFYMRRD